MTTKVKIIICIVALAGAFASGRWLAPTKTVTVTVEKIVEKEKSDKDEHKKVVTHEIVKPDGTKDTTTTVTDDIDTKTSEVVSDDKSSTTTVTRDSSKVTISALGGVSLSPTSTVFGASLTKPVLGPITIGVWGLSNSTFGASIGLTF